MIPFSKKNLRVNVEEEMVFPCEVSECVKMRGVKGGVVINYS
jgi:hypothetical protein